MSALVTHVCSGTDAEVDISLDVLTDLVTQHTSVLMCYAAFVKVIYLFRDCLYVRTHYDTTYKKIPRFRAHHHFPEEAALVLKKINI